MGENGWADNRGTETLQEVTGRKKGSPKEVRVGRKLPSMQMTLGEGPAGGGLDYEQPGEQKLGVACHQGHIEKVAVQGPISLLDSEQKPCMDFPFLLRPSLGLVLE